jgi:anti-sigma regulatory factor (Ser/Thr protein kinase)
MSGGLLSAPDFGDFAHQLLAYGSTEELVAAAAPFVRAGVADGDAVMMVGPPEKADAVRDALEPEEAERARFRPALSHYAAAGPALTGTQQLLAEHVAEGRRVRVLGEPPLGRVDSALRRALCRNDAAFNEVACVPGASVVCLVDVREVPAEALAAMRRCHPEIVEGGVRRPSEAFADPATVLAEEQARPLPDPPDDAEVHELEEGADPATARAFVHGLLEGVLDAERRSDFVTAVNEVVANAVTYAVLDRVRLWWEGGRVVCEVGDGGAGLPDPLVGYRQPRPEQTEGWGLWLARQLAQVVEVCTGPGGSAIRLHAPLAHETGGR